MMNVVDFSLSDTDVEIIWEKQTNATAADAQSPSVIKSSAAMTLTMEDTLGLVFYQE